LTLFHPAFDASFLSGVTITTLSSGATYLRFTYLQGLPVGTVGQTLYDFKFLAEHRVGNTPDTASIQAGLIPTVGNMPGRVRAIGRAHVDGVADTYRRLRLTTHVEAEAFYTLLGGVGAVSFVHALDTDEIFLPAEWRFGVLALR
jgi:hypothetical protein